MIFYWLGRALRGLASLFIPPPPYAHARINPNAQCPACGNRKGKLLFSESTGQVEHGCAICGARWAEPTIAKSDAWKPKTTEGLRLVGPA